MKYADIGAICSFLGTKVSLTLPSLHAITGCDTTSYLYKVGKVKILKKLIRNPVFCDLLESLGKSEALTVEDMQKIKEFTRKIIYSGKANETYIETRVRLYKSMKVKSSMSLPPDPDSLFQVIKRAHHQAYFWQRCLEKEIYQLEVENYGWRWCEERRLMTPVWYTGDQLYTGDRLSSPSGEGKFNKITPMTVMQIQKRIRLTVNRCPEKEKRESTL